MIRRFRRRNEVLTSRYARGSWANSFISKSGFEFRLSENQLEDGKCSDHALIEE